jgi:MFS superfamily sulfate permease-like transporter
MNSLPPSQRGAGAGMLATFNVSSSVLSIGVFFTLMIVGLASGLPHTMRAGLVAHGVAPGAATQISHLPPVATLFAAFLGYNPVKTLLGPRVHDLSPANAHALTGRGFFPHLISSPFHTALVYAFIFAIVACVVAAFASLLRGGKYVHTEAVAVDPLDVEVAA